MTLKELWKQVKRIDGYELDNSFKIFLCKDNYFLAEQYVDEMCVMLEKKKQYIHDLDEARNDTCDFFGVEDDEHLFILKVDEFTSNYEDLNYFENTIVLCHKIGEIFDTPEIIEFNNVDGWQLQDYMRYKCQGLDPKIIKWLYDITNKDVYRIDNELNKIAIFPKDKQTSIFQLLNDENCYEDLNPTTVFNLADAIINKNKEAIKNILREINLINIDAFGLIGCLYNKFLLILSIKSNTRLTAKALGISENQFKYIRDNQCRAYELDRLIVIFDFITKFDYLVKSGTLGLSNDKLIDYIVCELVA